MNSFSNRKNLEFQDVLLKFLPFLKNHSNRYTVDQLESIFYKLDKIDRINHYSLIDPNVFTYSHAYEKTIYSTHSERIAYLSSLLDLLPQSNIIDPLESYHDLENFISSKQFLVSGLNKGNRTHIRYKLECLLSELQIALTFVQKNGKYAYNNELSSYSGYKQFASQSFGSFTRDIESTIMFLQLISEKLETHK